MSIKNVYEVLNDFKAATTKADRLDVLKRNDTFALRSILQGTFAPNIKFRMKDVPEWKRVEVPPGLSYSHMTEALSRAYLFVEGHPRRPEGLTDKRETELLIQLLESLEPQEAEIYAGMIRKDLKVPYLTAKLVNEAFPGLVPDITE
jgi:hypothetical protein